MAGANANDGTLFLAIFYAGRFVPTGKAHWEKFV